MSALVPTGAALATTSFSFEAHEVRTVTIDGEPWFVLAHVCKVLDIENPGNAAARLDDDEKGLHNVDTLGGPQQMVVINESGLYSVILTSRKETARRFKKWVTGEVLPSIRRTGSYAVPAIDLTDRKTLGAQLLISLQREGELEHQLEQQTGQIAELTPKAEALDLMSAAKGEQTLTQTAKGLGTHRDHMIRWMLAEKLLYRSGNRSGGLLLAHQTAIDRGLLVQNEHYVEETGRMHPEVRVTAKGVTWLAEHLPEEIGGRGRPRKRRRGADVPGRA